MNKKLVLFFVRRYLRFDRDQPFISLSAILAFIGITLGVMVLIIAMSIMNGFDRELQNRLSIMNYPLTVVSTSSDYVNTIGVNFIKRIIPEAKISPYVVSSVVAKYGREMRGGFLFGVDFNLEKKINPVIDQALKMNQDNINKSDSFFVITGKKFIEDTQIPLNKKITYIFTEVDPAGLISTPKIKRFELVGGFNSGLSSYDETYHFSELVPLQKVLGMAEDHYHGIHIFSENPLIDHKKLSQHLSNNYRVVGWWEQNGNLFSALEMEKRALFIVLMLIILIASVNIISSLLMTVMNRRSEIALLVSMGATDREIRRIFLYLGIVVGISGIIFGTLLGLFGVFILSHFDIISLPADIYGTSHLPLELSVTDFISILIGAVIIVIVSAIYPARKASQIDIIKVLKNE
jgi:putative ABC transport system permease protein